MLILSPVQKSSESSSAVQPPVYRLTNHASTPLQKSSIGTSVIQTVQLAQQNEKTYVIKQQSHQNPSQSQTNQIQHCKRGSVVRMTCRNETYAQCTKCQVLVQLQVSASSNHLNMDKFVCQTCLSSSTSTTYSTK